MRRVAVNDQKWKFSARAIIIILAIVFMAGTATATELTVGLIPEQNIFKQMKRYTPVGEYIQKRTGIKIKFTVLSKYGNIIESFQKKKMDGAFWGSFTGALAINKLGVEPIARPVNLDGKSTYKGYIFVHKYSVIDSVARMRHSVIAFVDRATTAGYVFPLSYLKQNGVKDIDGFFKEMYFAGTHDAVIYAVLNKKAEIGCAKNTIFDMIARDDPRVKDDLTILAESPEVPSNSFALRKDISDDIKKRIKGVLINMDQDPEGKVVLEKFGARAFIETTAKDYAPVFDIAKKAGINLTKYNYVNE